MSTLALPTTIRLGKAADYIDVTIQPIVPGNRQTFPRDERDIVSLSYIASLKDGNIVEIRLKENPFIGMVGLLPCEGLRRGILEISLGEKSRLTIPSEAAFGEEGEPALGIPPNAEVTYEVELLEVYYYHTKDGSEAVEMGK